MAPLAALVPTAPQPAASLALPLPLPPGSPSRFSPLAAQLLAAVFGLRFGCHLPFVAACALRAAVVVFLVVARLAVPVPVCVCACVCVS